MAERGRPRGFDRQVALRDAMLMFWNKGFEETSMTDLTQATGLRSASLYAAFGSKEAIFREALDMYQETLGPMIWASLEDATIEGAIESFLMRTADAFSDPAYPAGCMIVLGAHHARQGASAVGDELQRRRANDIRRLKQRFDVAIQAGDLAATFDSQAAAAFYAALQAGMSILARDGATPATLRAVAISGTRALDEMKARSQSSD
ncbi:TetR/AcrR family transcriptional regulator [Achromobacter sp. KS-M25]|nr:TetR/AcrR family transcriptional regulator [Achromobacter aestuarii]